MHISFRITFNRCSTNIGTKEGALYVEGDYGDTGGIKLPITKNGEKISIVAQSSENNLQESFYIQELIRRTGIDLEVITIPASTFQKIQNLWQQVAMQSLISIQTLFHGKM